MGASMYGEVPLVSLRRCKGLASILPSRNSSPYRRMSSRVCLPVSSTPQRLNFMCYSYHRSYLVILVRPYQDALAVCGSRPYSMRGRVRPKYCRRSNWGEVLWDFPCCHWSVCRLSIKYCLVSLHCIRSETFIYPLSGFLTMSLGITSAALQSPSTFSLGRSAVPLRATFTARGTRRDTKSDVSASYVCLYIYSRSLVAPA